MLMTDENSLDFVLEPITVTFDDQPVLSKSPNCPSTFTWRDENYRIIEMLATWSDYRRRGRFARNMRPEHAATASRRGSWGVGRFYFRVRVEDGRAFDIYYDRSPESAGDRKGSWFLLGERRGI